MQKKRYSLLAATLLLSLMSYGCTTLTTNTAQAPKPAKAEQPADPFVYKGSVVGKSNKAKTISIKLGKGEAAKTMMVRFDDNTQGMKYAKKGEAAVVRWEMRDGEKFATVVKPKLAKLPAGVTEIKTEAMFELLTAHTPMTVIDARPTSRYHQAHLPGSLSIPVPKLKKEQGSILPDDKDKLLVFYCGGPT